MATEAVAPAKINLTLNVTGQRDDGYHLLDSLVVFADIGDTLQFTPGAKLSLEVVGEHAQGVPADSRNLVWQAAEAAGWIGHIRLNKVLPHGGGIGGGSSDAAAVFRMALAEGYQVPENAPLSLGADIPVCMTAKAARMRGIGEDISVISLPPLFALLVNPGVEVPTGSVFRAMATRTNPAMPETLPAFPCAKSCAEWLNTQRNDLEPPAAALAPQITDVLHALAETRDAMLTRMSGSGSTCFALYPSMKAAHFAAYEIGAAHPNWWCRATQLS